MPGDKLFCAVCQRVLTDFYAYVRNALSDHNWLRVADEFCTPFTWFARYRSFPTRNLFGFAFAAFSVCEHLCGQMVPGSMADESKAPQSPDSSKPEAPGASTEPTTATNNAVASASSASKSIPPPSKRPPVVQTPLDNELTKRYRERFGAGILDALEDREQPYLIVDSAQLLEIACYSRDEEKFDLLEDYTAVDWPRREKRFDLIAILYSFQHNLRVRLKVPLAAQEEAGSLVAIWPVANWLEREIFDMFGIVFKGHPDLKRILLPEEWQGHPLRKDYDILQQDTAWVRENLGIESGQ
jgi:NADH-quinone oxidoreductase subunit C